MGNKYHRIMCRNIASRMVYIIVEMVVRIVCIKVALKEFTVSLRAKNANVQFVSSCQCSGS